MPNSDITVRELFEAFVYFRRQGATPDYALQELRKMKPIISSDEREELANLVKRWENGEGTRYRPSLEAHVQPLPSKRQGEDTLESIACTNCGAVNRADASYCYACGEVMILFGTHRLPAVNDEDESRFSEQSRLVFIVRGYEDAPIEINIHQRPEMIIGRAAPDNPIVPDIDLSEYDGKRLGVSRVHATLKNVDQAITVSDMGSVNHTFLNGDRVHPQEVRVLHDGDELRLGQLVVRASFQRALKRIRN